MNPVAVIELNDNTHLEKVVKEMVDRRGYFTKWTNRETVLLLPFNCVWKTPVPDLRETLADLRTSIQIVNREFGLSLELAKCVILNSSPWDGLTEPYKPQ
jgi:hypothetical protein